MGFYDDMLGTATDLLAEFGQAALLRRRSGAFDPVAGTASDAVADTAVLAVVEDYRQSEVDGTTMLRGDRRVIVQAVVAPREGDSLVLGGREWSVVSFTAVDPAGVALLYELQVRA